MYYIREVTVPTKVENVADYRERIYEITHGQMKNVVLKERLLNPFFLFFSVLFVPLSVIYLVICICEIVVTTLLLPFSCTRYLRGIAFLICVIVWSLGVAIGAVALIPMTYDLDYRPKKKKTANSDNSVVKIRQGIISKQINMAANLYVQYGAMSRFEDDMGVLCEEYTNILLDGENAYGIKAFYFGINSHNLSSAERKCLAVSMYYLFDLQDLNYPKDKVIGAVSQIILNETFRAKSFFNLTSWFEVRLVLIEKIKGYV